MSCSEKEQLFYNWKNRFFFLCPQKWLNHFFLECKRKQHPFGTDETLTASPTKLKPYRNTLKVSKFQPSRCKLLKVEVRKEIICKAVVAAVPTTMKSLASVLLELLSQKKNPLCALFSDSQWSTTKSPGKKYNPLLFVMPQTAQWLQ